MAVSEIDLTRAEEFGGRMLATMNGAMLALAISVGHRTGLYDALAELEPATSEEIADRDGAAGALRARVARRTARRAGSSSTTPRRGPGGCRASTRSRSRGPPGASNLAFLAGSVSRFGELEDDVRRRLPRRRRRSLVADGAVAGVAVASSAAATTTKRSTPCSSSFPGWSSGCARGSTSSTRAAGTGMRPFGSPTRSRPAAIVGYDQAAASVDAARAEAERLGDGNARFEVHDVVDLEPSAYDLVLALDVVHDLARPYEALRAIHEALRPGGVLLMAEHALSHRPEQNVAHPLAPRSTPSRSSTA